MQTLVETAISNALVAGALALVAFALSRLRRPALAHGLWLLVLVKLITPPLLPVYLPIFESAPAGRSESVPPQNSDPERIRFSSSEELAEFLALAGLAGDSEPADVVVKPAVPSAPKAEPTTLDWRECVIPLWIGGALLWMGLTICSVCRFQWLLRSARPAPRSIQNQTRLLAARLGLTRCPQVRLVGGAVSPMVWAVGAAPRLLFPSGLLDRLDEEQRAALLLHELAHIRRRDHWVRFVELIVVALYWWNPVVWWARRELREAEEQCCDAWVVWASSGEGTAYAHALLETVAFVSRTRFPLPASASGIGHIPHLRRRLTMIMQADTPRSLSAAGWLLLGLAAFALPVAARAQPPGQANPREQEIKALKAKLLELEAAGKDGQALLGLVLTEEGEQDADNAKRMKAVADLKAQIAKKRTELQDLEAKLKALVAGKEAKKGVKIKVDPATFLIDDVKAKVDQEKVKAEKATKEAVEKALKQVMEIDINLDDLIKKGVLPVEKIKDKLQIRAKDGLPIEVILDNIKIDGDKKDMVIKLLDATKKEELKRLDDLKKLDALKKVEIKKLDGVRKGEIVVTPDGKLHDVKVIVEGGGGKGGDIEARLERLMKELQELQREVKASKKPQVK